MYYHYGKWENLSFVQRLSTIRASTVHNYVIVFVFVVVGRAMALLTLTTVAVLLVVTMLVWTWTKTDQWPSSAS